MFQFPGFASKPLWIQDLDTSTDPPSGNHTVSHAVTRQEVEGGFPHSEILGSKPVRGSPRLIAAYHVLHRLSAPRHPPNALMTLDRSHDRCSLKATTFENVAPVTQSTIRKTLQTPPSANSKTPCQHAGQPDAFPRQAGAPVMLPSSRCQSSAEPSPAGGVVRAYEALCSGYPDARRSTPLEEMVEPDGIEPTTSCLQSTRSPN